MFASSQCNASWAFRGVSDVQQYWAPLLPSVFFAYFFSFSFFGGECCIHRLIYVLLLIMHHSSFIEKNISDNLFFFFCLLNSFAVFTTEIQFDYNTIGGRVRELAFLNPKVELLLFIMTTLILLIPTLSSQIDFLLEE